jgi:TonB family protein
VPFKQKPETEKIAISDAAAGSINQDNDPKIVNIGVINGKAVKLPLPEYPDEARRGNVGGSVSVQVIVDEEGNVTSANAIPVIIKIIKADGTETNVNPEEMAVRKLINEAAETAAREAKFAPTLLSGKPVRVKGIIVYNFGADKNIERKTISGEVLNGKATSLPVPEYPSAAKAVKAAGAVQIQVVVDEEGNVTSAEAVSGHPLLRQAAVKAAKEAKFSPTFLNGQAVKVNGVLVYNFAPATGEPTEINEDRGNIKDGAAEASVDSLKILSKPLPQYTDEARKNNVTGTIKLRVTFLASGSIGDVIPESTLPDGLTEIAIEAAKGIKFKPATRNGEPLTVTKLVEYSFSSF